MTLTGNIDAGSLIVLVLIAIIAYLNRREYLEMVKLDRERLSALEIWKVDHDTWASARSDMLSSLQITAQRLGTLIEVMDKRVSRIEDFHLKHEPMK